MKRTLHACLFLLIITTSCKSGRCVTGAENIPQPFMDQLFETTEVRRWKSVDGSEAYDIAQRAKREYYDTNNLWGADLHQAEVKEQLVVFVLESKCYVAVVWVYKATEELAGRPFQQLQFNGICYKSENREVVFMGSGTVPVGYTFNSVRMGEKKVLGKDILE